MLGLNPTIQEHVISVARVEKSVRTKGIFVPKDMPRQSLENILLGSIEELPTGNAFHKSGENCLARSGKWRLPRTARHHDLLSPRWIQLAKSNRIPSLCGGLLSAFHLDQLYRNLECGVDLLVYRL